MFLGKPDGEGEEKDLGNKEEDTMDRDERSQVIKNLQGTVAPTKKKKKNFSMF